MCAPLTINCQQRRHALTLGSKYIVPCSKPGSEACRKGEAEPNETWQNSPTECVGEFPSSLFLSREVAGAVAGAAAGAAAAAAAAVWQAVKVKARRAKRAQERCTARVFFFFFFSSLVRNPSEEVTTERREKTRYTDTTSHPKRAPFPYAPQEKRCAGINFTRRKRRRKRRPLQLPLLLKTPTPF